jgi:hypothetical protein
MYSHMQCGANCCEVIWKRSSWHAFKRAQPTVTSSCNACTSEAAEHSTYLKERAIRYCDALNEKAMCRRSGMTLEGGGGVFTR